MYKTYINVSVVYMFKAVYILYAKGIYLFSILLCLEGDSGVSGVKTMASYQEMKKMVQGICRLYERGKASAGEVALQMQEALGVVQDIKYQEDAFSISDGTNKYSLNTRGMKEKTRIALVAALDGVRAGVSELHLGKNASSKHHKAGLENVLRQARSA